MEWADSCPLTAYGSHQSILASPQEDLKKTALLNLCAAPPFLIPHFFMPSPAPNKRHYPFSSIPVRKKDFRAPLTSAILTVFVISTLTTARNDERQQAPE
jgi:ABC-type Co2+ transport system permease subunit